MPLTQADVGTDEVYARLSLVPESDVSLLIPVWHFVIVLVSFLMLLPIFGLGIGRKSEQERD